MGPYLAATLVTYKVKVNAFTRMSLNGCEVFIGKVAQYVAPFDGFVMNTITAVDLYTDIYKRVNPPWADIGTYTATSCPVQQEQGTKVTLSLPPLPSWSNSIIICSAVPSCAPHSSDTSRKWVWSSLRGWVWFSCGNWGCVKCLWSQMEGYIGGVGGRDGSWRLGGRGGRPGGVAMGGLSRCGWSPPKSGPPGPSVAE